MRQTLPLLVVSLLLLWGCGERGSTPGETDDAPATTDAAERTAPRGSEGTAESTGASGLEEEASDREVALEIGGTPGTRFAGRCAIGDEDEKRIEGTAPARFEYDPGEARMECRVLKQGVDTGTIEVALVVDGKRYVQTTNGRWGSINIVLSGETVSAAVRSSASTADGGEETVMSSGSTTTR